MRLAARAARPFNTPPRTPAGRRAPARPPQPPLRVLPQNSPRLLRSRSTMSTPCRRQSFDALAPPASPGVEFLCTTLPTNACAALACRFILVSNFCSLLSRFENAVRPHNDGHQHKRHRCKRCRDSSLTLFLQQSAGCRSYHTDKRSNSSQAAH